MSTKREKPKKSSSKKKQPTPKGAMVVKDHLFTLTLEESNELGKEIAKLDHGIAELESQFEHVKTDWKARITSAEAKRKEISAIVHAQKQKRTVETTMVKNYESGEVEYWYEGEVLEKRTMTAEEFQMTTDDYATNAKKAKKLKEKITEPTGAQKAYAAAEPGHSGKKGQLKAVPSVVNGAGEDIASVIAEETGRRTKSSAVDGPVEHAE